MGHLDLPGDAVDQEPAERPEPDRRHHLAIAGAHQPELLSVEERLLDEVPERAVERAHLAIERGIEPGRVLEEDLRHRRIVERDGEDPHQVRAQLCQRRACRIRGVDALDALRDAREEPIDELLEDRPLVLEVEIERPARDLGTRDDVVDLRLVVPLLGEDVAGAIEDLRASLLAPDRRPTVRRRHARIVPRKLEKG